MRAGKLRHRLQIQSAIETQDRMGQPKTTWTTFAEPRAGMKSVNGRRFVSKSGEAVEATHTFSLRYRADITPACRILLGTRRFDIVFCDIVDGRNRELLIVVNERVL